VGGGRGGGALVPPAKLDPGVGDKPLIGRLQPVP
jgi:hypothetical protein